MDYKKITLASSMFYASFILSLLLILNTSLGWLFIENFTFITYTELYPNYTKIAFILLRILPIVGLVLVMVLHLFLLKNEGIGFISIYNNVLGGNSLIGFLLLAFISLLVYQNIGVHHLNHHIAIVIAMWVLACYLFTFKSLPSKYIQITFLILIAFVLRYFYYIYASPYDIGDDSLARVAQVYSWQKYGGLPGGLAWPGGHHLLIYFVSKIFNVPFEVGGRLLSLIASVLIIPFGYQLFHSLYNKTTAFFSLFFYALHPFFIKYATIQMTEIPFLFLMTIGVLYAYKYFKKGGLTYLLLSIIPLNMASLLRFEAWIIIPLFSIIFLFSYADLKKVMKWSLLSLISALYFAWLSYIKSGNPIYGVTASDIEVVETLIGFTFLDSFKSMLTWPWVPILFFPLLFLGLIYTLKKGKNKYLVFFISILCSYYFYKIGEMTLMPFWRYLTFVIFFLMPVMFYYLERNLSITAVFILFSLINITYSSREAENAYGSYKAPPSGLLESALLVKSTYLQKDDVKLILSINPFLNYGIWRVYSNVYIDYPVFHRLHPGSVQNESGELFTKEILINKIVNQDYNLILVQESYEIDSVFDAKEVLDFLNEKQVDTTHFEELTLYYIN